MDLPTSLRSPVHIPEVEMDLGDRCRVDPCRRDDVHVQAFASGNPQIIERNPVIDAGEIGAASREPHLHAYGREGSSDVVLLDLVRRDEREFDVDRFRVRVKVRSYGPCDSNNGAIVGNVNCCHGIFSTSCSYPAHLDD